MPDFVNLTPDQTGEVSARLGAVLRQGQLVVMPTDAGLELAASALQGEAVRALAALEGRIDAPTLALSQPAEIWDWLPYLRGAGYRLARHFWPGPLTLLARAGLSQGLWPRLPRLTQDILVTSAGMPFRVPRLACELPWPAGEAGPIVVAPIAASASELATMPWVDQVGLVVTSAAPEPPRVPSWVELQESSWRLVKTGAITQDEIQETAPCRILFVCTGNTCRSPLAAALCRKLLADRIGCAQPELPGRGFLVQSAGLAAILGAEATPEVVAIAAEQGADLGDHRSQALGLEMLAWADHLLTMTQGHLRLLESLELDVGPRPRLLSPRGDDVDDPLGGGPEVYQACADQLLACLRERLPEFLEN